LILKGLFQTAQIDPHHFRAVGRKVTKRRRVVQHRTIFSTIALASVANAGISSAVAVRRGLVIMPAKSSLATARTVTISTIRSRLLGPAFVGRSPVINLTRENLSPCGGER
jgi:hypothetical protein